VKGENPYLAHWGKQTGTTKKGHIVEKSQANELGL
jgi:hypothetical protein